MGLSKGSEVLLELGRVDTGLVLIEGWFAGRRRERVDGEESRRDIQRTKEHNSNSLLARMPTDFSN